MLIPQGGFERATGGGQAAAPGHRECFLAIGAATPADTDALVQHAVAAGADLIIPPGLRKQCLMTTGEDCLTPGGGGTAAWLRGAGSSGWHGLVGSRTRWDAVSAAGRAARKAGFPAGVGTRGEKTCGPGILPAPPTG
jgi:hypothetical protein